MATYPGMSLNGEVRESVSLDEDDLSDVEDEVFIRDGKSGYKFAEDIGLKRPLMAPRRKIGRNDLTSRLKSRPPCKALCKPCCYIIGALTVLLGLIIIVVILVSMFPLPIDRIKNWIKFKTSENITEQVLPCSDLKVTDVWTATFPKLLSESSIWTIDINKDNIEDVIFGYGTALDNSLHPDIFCPMFMGFSPPCEGGVIALNGLNGEVLWRRGLTHSVFSIICSHDINGDGLQDCLVTGKGGIFCTIDATDGTIIWQFDDKEKPSTLVMDVYSANFIQDQDGDNVPDILASHTLQSERSRTGHLLILSAKKGTLLSKIATPNSSEIYYAPQYLNDDQILFGTGGPSSPGNLYLTSLRNITTGNLTAKSIYEDKYKGILSPSVLVDINGDEINDIISSMFNTTVIAFDGKTMMPIWNFTLPNSETLGMPIPGYFNNDNVTDFFVKYQTGIEFPTYFYSQAFILDGKTGKPINKDPIIDTVGYQIGGLTLQMEKYGMDMFLYWMADCKNFEGKQDTFQFKAGSTIPQQSHANMCKLRFNSTTVAKLYALNQFDQPPGIKIYDSDERSSLEYNNTQNQIEEAKTYMKSHPNLMTGDNGNTPSNTLDALDPTSENFRTVQYKGRSSFRHKGGNQGLIRDFGNRKKTDNLPGAPKLDDFDPQPINWQGKIPTYSEPMLNEDIDNDFNNYFDDNDRGNLYNPNSQYLVKNNEQKMTNRDPRSKLISEPNPSTTTDKNDYSTEPSIKEKSAYGIYDYKNIHNARNRLLHDLNSLPSQILRDTYFKNRERDLRKSRFEQRDITSHKDKLKDNEEVTEILENEKKNSYNSTSLHLWDLESENELKDKKNGLWRGKRDVSEKFNGVPKLTSIGVLVDAINSSLNKIDLIFITYWLPSKNGVQVLLEKDIQCVEKKVKEALNAKDQTQFFDEEALKGAFENDCIKERGAFNNNNNNVNKNLNDRNLPYYNQISQLRMGQLTVYRIRLECSCSLLKNGDRCAKFLPNSKQRWSSYFGKQGDGVFNN